MMLLFTLFLAVPACLGSLREAGFTCPGLGNFPNPEDCATYYACAAGSDPILMSCPPGTLFDPLLKLCNTAAVVQCDSGPSSEEPSTSSSTSSSTSISTTTGAPDTSITTSSSTSTSTSTSTTSLPPSTGGPGPNCPFNGTAILENPDDCRTYYVCIDGDYALLDCPPGYGYDKEKQKCSLAEEVGCGIGVSSTTPNPEAPECPPTGVHILPNPDDCGTFYICINGQSDLISCPIGYEFNAKTEQCEADVAGECSSTGSTASTGSTGSTASTGTTGSTGSTGTTGSTGSTDSTGTTSSTTAGPTPDCSGIPDGSLLPDPTDCTRFYQCSNGVAFSNNCPPGLEFNAAQLVCDHPELANCTPLIY